MTLAERARLATEKRQRKAAERAERVRAVFTPELNLKRVAHLAGVPYRTACRYTLDMRS